MIILYNTKFYKVLEFIMTEKEMVLVLPQLALRISKLYEYLSCTESTL